MIARTFQHSTTTTTSLTVPADLQTTKSHTKPSIEMPTTTSAPLVIPPTNPPPNPAPAPANPRAPNPCSRYLLKSITFTTNYILPILFTLGLGISTYFCALALSAPQDPSHTALIIALIGLSGLSLIRLPVFLSLLTGIQPSHILPHALAETVNIVSFHLFFGFLGYCAFVATYFGVKALVTGYSMALIVAMFPLCALDMVLVCFFLDRLCLVVGVWRAPGKVAKRKWVANGGRRGVGGSREMVMAQVEMEVRRAEGV